MVQQIVIWSTFCLLALIAALWRPRAAQIGLGLFFIVMAVGVNVVFVVVAPDDFVALGTDAPLLGVYRWTFEHVVATAPAVFGLAIAAFEITVGVWMVRGGRFTRWGALGGSAFLVLSSPLGPWTLPNLVLAVAVLAVWWRQPEAATTRSVVARPSTGTAPLGTGRSWT